ncbi:DUF4209 domain-containing protein [Cobetia marina]|uniref:DUF4209 domain-containing protein n=1 Tax=Cobetia marina TaxID=28258 RepID=A0ABU9GDE2_COBMA
MSSKIPSKLFCVQIESLFKNLFNYNMAEVSMSLCEIVVDCEALSQLDLSSIFSNIKENSCHHLESALSAHKEKDAAILLAAACSMHFTPNDSNNPLKPKFVFENHRGLIPNDLNKETLFAIKEFCINVENHELRARLADIVWITRSGTIDHAYIAIEAYLESAKQLSKETNIWVLVCDRIERALRLSVHFRRHGQRPDLFESVSKFMIDQFHEFKNTDKENYLERLLELFLEFDLQGNEWIYDQALEIYKLHYDRCNYNFSISANRIALRAAINMRSKEKEYSIWESISDCHIKAAKEQTGILAAGQLMKAIDALAKVPKTKNRRLALYEEMREQQIESLHEFSLLESDGCDISEIVGCAISRVKSVDLFDALFRLGLITKPVSIEKLKASAIDQMHNSIAWMFGATHIDHEGMTTSVIPPSVGIEEDSNGLQIWSIMMRNISIEHQLHVQAKIMPALNEISATYSISEDMVINICSNHPFIPDGHEEYFVKGLLAGFNRDFMTSCHLLIPQIENSLRYIARQQGYEPTTLHGDGSQERRGIKLLLENQSVINALGFDLTTNLQIILLDKVYGDLRNQLSHGYIPASSYYGDSPKYLWWLILHIIMRPCAKHWIEVYRQDNSLDDEAE